MIPAVNAIPHTPSSKFIQLPQHFHRSLGGNRTCQTPATLRSSSHRTLDSLRRAAVVAMHVIPYPGVDLVYVIGEVHRCRGDK